MLSWQTSPTLMPTDCSVPSTLTIIYNYFLFHKTTCVIYSISECSIINFNLHFVTLPSNSISSKSPDILSTLPKPYFLPKPFHVWLYFLISLYRYAVLEFFVILNRFIIILLSPFCVSGLGYKACHNTVLYVASMTGIEVDFFQTGIERLLYNLCDIHFS